jgi:hypothetical protein
LLTPTKSSIFSPSSSLDQLVAFPGALLNFFLMSLRCVKVVAIYQASAHPELIHAGYPEIAVTVG